MYASLRDFWKILFLALRKIFECVFHAWNSIELRRAWAADSGLEFLWNWTMNELKETSLMTFFLFLALPRALTDVIQPRFRPQEPKLWLMDFWKIPALVLSQIFKSLFHAKRYYIRLCISQRFKPTSFYFFLAGRVSTMVDKIPWDTCVIALIFGAFKTEF